MLGILSSLPIQEVDEDGNVTTLGGGSDTTAVAVAAALSVWSRSILMWMVSTPLIPEW